MGRGINVGRPSLRGLKQIGSGAFDENGLGSNMALDRRAVADADQYYKGQEAADVGNVQATAEDWRQHGAAIAPGDPQGFRAFHQGIKESGGAITPRSGFLGTGATSAPFQVDQQSTIFDPMRQESAVDPTAALNALVALSVKRRGER